MPRPKRPGWSKITITVSDEVARYIRVQAADQGIEMGTFVDRTLGASLRAAKAPQATPPPDPPPPSPAQPAAGRAGPPIAPDLMDLFPAEASGDNPTRMAEFAYQKAVADPDSRVFRPLRHLQVADDLSPATLSAALFRSIVSSALSAADFEVRCGFGVRTLKFLDAVLQTADQFFRQLQAEFPADDFRMSLWTPHSAAAFGILFGKRIGEPVNGPDLEETAQRVSAAVIGMLKGLTRTNPKAAEFLKREAPAHQASILTLNETQARRRDQRGADGDAPDTGYGYFT